MTEINTNNKISLSKPQVWAIFLALATAVGWAGATTVTQSQAVLPAYIKQVDRSNILSEERIQVLRDSIEAINANTDALKAQEAGISQNRALITSVLELVKANQERIEELRLEVKALRR